MRPWEMIESAMWMAAIGVALIWVLDYYGWLRVPPEDLPQQPDPLPGIMTCKDSGVGLCELVRDKGTFCEGGQCRKYK